MELVYFTDGGEGENVLGERFLGALEASRVPHMAISIP